MKIRLAVLAMLMCAVGAKGQAVPSSDTFTFGGSTSTCASITSWNGDPNIYALDRGAVCLHSSVGGGYGSAIEVPFQLGFLNNGFLVPCDPFTFTKAWTSGDGTHDGDTFTLTGATTCPYFTGEYGGYSDNLLDGFSVVASYTHVAHSYYYRGRKYTYFTDVLEGGTGMVSEALLS
jgi:hypothetical protein